MLLFSRFQKLSSDYRIFIINCINCKLNVRDTNILYNIVTIKKATRKLL